MENETKCIEQFEQHGDHGGRGRELTLAEQTQQAFPRVGECLKTLIAQEPRRALDGVDRAEDLRDQCRIVGTLLEIGKAPFHAIKPFLALDQKLACQFVHRVCFRRTGWRSVQGHKGFIGLVA